MTQSLLKTLVLPLWMAVLVRVLGAPDAGAEDFDILTLPVVATFAQDLESGPVVATCHREASSPPGQMQASPSARAMVLR